MLSRYSKMLTNGVALLAMLMLTQAGYAAGDAERGKVLAETCIGCHGVIGYNNVYPTYHVPKVAGQNEAYIVSALKLYREDQRQHGTMTAQASSLTDQDIDDVAAYLAGAGGTKDAEANGSAPDAAQVCAACHGASGISPIPTNPNLAGQHLDYLQQALSDYKLGNRQGPNGAVMQAQIMTVSEEDLAAIVKYYSKQTGLDAL